jgi:hypothetical protein
MSKNNDDPMKKILERRQFIEDEREVEDDDPLPDISDSTEQPSKKKEERAAREELSSPIKKGPVTPTFDLGDALRKQMGNFKIPSVPEKQSKELDGEDAWADEPLEESRPVVREETTVKKEPGKINANSGLFSKVAGLFGGGQKKEEPKVGKLNPEAIKALANAKAEDLRRAAEREELPGESRVSVTSAELQKGSDIPIPPMMEPPPAPPLETRTTVAMDESSIPSAEKRKATVSEIPAPPLEKRETTGKDTKPTNFDEVLNKAGVVLSPNDQTLITEAFHKVGIIDRVPKRDKLLSEQIALTVSTVVKNNPELQPFVTEICDAFVDKAKQDATRTALNDRFGQIKSEYQKGSKVPEKSNKDLDIVIKDLEELQGDVSGKIGPKNAKELASKIDKIKEDYNTKSGEEQTKTLYQNLQSLKDWSSEKGKETADKSTWKKIGTVISSCMSLVAAKIAGKEVETIKNNLAQAMKELKTQGKKEVTEGLSKINTRAAENQRSR